MLARSCCLGVLCSFLFGISGIAYADGGPSCALTPNGVRIQVRTVLADERMQPMVREVGGIEQLFSEKGKQFDARLKDVSAKLRKLHFRSFRLLSTQREELPFGKRGTLSVGDGNSLTLRPIGISDEQVGMWLRWEDGDGMQVIDTRMQFAVGEALIAGVDRAGDSGLILAIDVQPVRLRNSDSSAAREP